MTLTELFTNIANAIRRKDGTTGSIPAEDFPERIEAIDTAVAPTISVSSSGLITATSGSKSTTKQLSTQSEKTVTPSASSQTAVASGRYTTGAVTVAGDSNLKAENIKNGVSIFGVTGTLESNNYKHVNFGDSDVSISIDSQGHSQIKLSDSSITSSSQIVAIDFGAAIAKRSEYTYMTKTSSSMHADYNASTTHNFYCEFSGESGSVVPIVENGALVLHLVDFGGFYNCLDSENLLDATDWYYFDCQFVFTT